MKSISQGNQSHTELREIVFAYILQTLDNEMSTDDDNEYAEEKESYICAVCLDVYFNPYMCYPCHHIFCEPCLRTLAKDNPASTPCPLCRTIISRVFFQTGNCCLSLTWLPNYFDYLFVPVLKVLYELLWESYWKSYIA